MVAVLLLLYVHSDDLLSTPPEKIEMKYSNLGSRLDQLVARVESGEITDQDAARDAPIYQDESVGVTIYLWGKVVEVVDFLKANGGDPRNAGKDYIEAYVPVSLLGTTSEQLGVLRVREIIPPHQTHGDSTSQGVHVHDSPAWNEEGYRGQGIKVGIIDFGFEGFSDLMGTELPTNVEARCYAGIGKPSSHLAACELVSSALGFITGLGDHGTRVAEAVIDIAPEVSLYIANPQTPGDLEKTVDWMTQEDVSVINYSRGWLYSGPGDGTTPHSVDPLKSVDRAVEGGIVWVNSAGNEARSTWFGSHFDPDGNGYISFDDSSNDEGNGLQLRKGDVIIAQLRWDDSWDGAKSDFDLHLVFDSTNEIVRRSEDIQSGLKGNFPLEWMIVLPPKDGNYSLKAVHRGGNVPDWIQLVVSLGVRSIEHFTGNGSINSPSESSNSGMLSVGAAPWYNITTIEDYSSRGPTPDGRVKPDIVGATCGESVLDPLQFRRGFCGTSQSAPHLAGMAALVRQRFPQYSPIEVVDYLKGHAEQRGERDPNNIWGHGFAVLRKPAYDCGQSLTEEGSISGEWAKGCDSAVSERGHARYYTFNLGGRREVTLTLESSDADSYLYLREGEARSGPALHENNDYGNGDTDSRIVDTLDAGMYTIEATTNSAGQTGSYTLTVMVEEQGGTPLPPTAPGPLEDDRSSECGPASVQNNDQVERELSNCDTSVVLAPNAMSRDRDALVTLYNATGGANWKNSKNWLTDRPIYTWSGVYTDSGGRVIQLHRRSQQLSGEIPVELSNLTKLKTLDLSENQLSGEIPAELGSLTNLEWLEIGQNQLSGEIPAELARLTRLKLLDLSGNQLSGEISAELGNLTNLEWLKIGHNELSGEIPEELSKLANLENLDLGANEFNGGIPEELSSLTNLRYLDLAANPLGGEIPEELGKLTNLEALSLQRNQLSGEIPPELGSLTKLYALFLDDNWLSGEIPEELGSLNNLEFLQLSGNKLVGCIPDGLRYVETNDDLYFLGLPFCNNNHGSR